MPEVSIIVPIYNVNVDYLKELIKSLSSQTLTDAEFLLVFDGNNDPLEELCKTYANQDKRFTIIKKTHSGVSDTRNCGIQHANGEYISFVDADDWISPNIYSEAYHIAKENNSDIVFWDMASVYPNGLIEKEFYNSKTIPSISKSQKDIIMQQFVWVQHGKYAPIISVCCKLIKRDFIITNKIEFDKNIAIGEDRIFFFNAMSKAKTISYLNGCGYFYRQNSSSAMHKYHAGGLPFLIQYLNAFNRDFFEANRPIFGREAYRLFSLSWELTYMHKNNPDSYWKRMRQLSKEIKKKYIQDYLQQVDKKNLPIIKIIDLFLFRHKITISLWIRGLIRLYKNAHSS